MVIQFILPNHSASIPPIAVRLIERIRLRWEKKERGNKKKV